ncbi:MAG TPA: hypothetical protein PLL69_05215 [Gemmatimonadales bacterium]|nr:hypothetical protein [Gemmatimonadales bacterium]
MIWPDIARRLRTAPLLDHEPVPLNTCYVITLGSRQQMLALAAWLSSTACSVLAQAVAEPASGGHHRFGARAVGSLPLPDGCLDDPRLAELGAMAWCGDVQQEIDKLVAAALRLSDHEHRLLDALLPAGG